MNKEWVACAGIIATDMIMDNKKDEITEHLNKKGTQPLLKYSKTTKYNVLEYTLEHNFIELFKQLVDAHFHLQAPSYWPTLLFHTQNYESTKILLDAGIDPEIKDNHKRTAFIYRWRKLKERDDDVLWIFLFLKAMKFDRKSVLNFVKDPDVYYRDKIDIQNKLLQKMMLYIADFDGKKEHELMVTHSTNYDCNFVYRLS